MTGAKIVLTEFLNEFNSYDQDTKYDLLIELAERFNEVPSGIATRPFPELNRVPGCESEAYVWAEPIAGGRLKFHFAVENPQGISAKAMAVILDEALSDAPLEDVVGVSEEIVYRIFGQGITMGRGQGLMSMVAMVKALAKRQFGAVSGT